MTEKIKNHLLVNKNKYILGVLLLLSFGLRVWYSSRDSLIWWDEAVYIGMGKHIATLGGIGFWEIFRPPFLPLVYAFLYKIHLPLILLGKTIVILSSTALIYLVYLLAQKMKEGAGVWAGLFLSVTPVFFFFSKVPLSDITSTFIAALSLYFFANKKDFTAGLFIGIAFLTRFPQGLILVPILLSLLYREYDKDNFYIKRVFYASLKIIFGFFILLIPYLVSNYFLYGSALSPILLGNSIISGYSYLYNKGTWYYVQELWNTAPFLFLALFSLFAIVQQFREKTQKNILLVSTFFTALIFSVYFFLQPHKELRYSLVFIPYVSVLAGFGAVWLFDRLLFKKVFIAIFALGIIFFLNKVKPEVVYYEANPYESFYSYFTGKKGVYISTTPVPVAVSDIHIVELFEKMDGFQDLLNRTGGQLDGAIMNSCDIFCAGSAVGESCKDEISSIQKELKNKFSQSYRQKIGECEFSVFEKIK